jgi:hypothetical protein
MLILLATLFSLAWAAPFPATGSSALVSEKPGLFMSTKGFRMNAGNTAWIQSPPPKDIPSLVTVYKAPVSQHGQQPALSVRVDDLKSTQSLRKYVRRWMQDYTRFGFDVLTAKPIKINDQSAFLLDIVSRETQKQLRQVVFLKNKTAVILTCRDHRDSFSKSVQDCNQIVKSFKWNAD